MPKTAELDQLIKETKGAVAALEAKNDAILDSVEMVDGVMQVGPGQRDAFRANLAQIKSLNGDLTMWTEAKNLAEHGIQPTRDSIALAAAAGGAHIFGGGMSVKSIGQMFTDSDEFKAFKQSGRLTMERPWEIKGVDLGAHAVWKPEQKDIYTASPTGAIPNGFAPKLREDMVPRAFRRTRVRDLFPVRQTTAALIEYFRVTGFTGTSNAAPVAERTAGAFTAKPQTPLTFVGVQSPVRLIAHWEAAHRNVLDDVPQIQGIIETELLYGLRLKEDDELLNGDGTGEHLTGILQTSGIQTYSRPGSPAANENRADDIRRAATKVVLSYYEPTGIVVHPADWESIEMLKDTTGAYLVAVAVAMGAEQRLWRLPVVDTPAIASGTALVGAFGLGAQLYDRMEANIRIAEQHSDFFVRNAIVVLAEQRLALTVTRPEAFVKVTLGA